MLLCLLLQPYLKAETSQDPNSSKVYNKRYLSLIPKPNDYGISRGADENNFPEDIELDWDTFAEIIGLNENQVEAPKKSALQELIDSISDAPVRPNVATKPNITPAVAPKPTVVAPKPATPTKPVVAKPAPAPVEEVSEEPTLNKVAEEETVAPSVSKTDVLAKLKAKKAVEEAPKAEETVKEEVVEEVSKPVEAPKPTVNKSDVAAKLAALKAKSKK